MFRENFISIIMPVYNAELYVKNSLESVLSQNFINYELIIINDCSIDGSLEIIKRYETKYSQIKILELAMNSGAGVARNAGLSVAVGRYIAFIDSDDVWLPNKLCKQLQTIKNSNAAICHSSYSIIDDSGCLIKGGVIASDVVHLSDYMKTTQIGLSTSLIDRSKTGDFSFEVVRTRQDTLLWLRLLSQGNFSVGLKDVLVHYRVRKGQISSNKFHMLYRTLKVYWTVKSIPPFRRILYFIQYSLNGVFKRLFLKKFH